MSNRWLVLLLLLAIAVLNYADRFLISGLAQPIKHEFGISDGMVGLLMGPAFALLYTVFAIPVARLADRSSRIVIICAGCAVWSFFTLLSGLAQSTAVLTLARIGVGIGEAAYQAPAAALIAAYFPVEQRTRAMAVMGTAIYLGQICGLAVGPAIAEERGWRAAFEALGIAGLVVAFAAVLLIREPRRVAAAVPVERLPLLPTLSRLWRTGSVRNMAVAMGMGTLSGVTFGMWGPALFERAYDLSTKEAGTTFVLTFGLPGLIGMMGFGFLADRLARRDRSAPLRLSAVALGSTTALILVITWIDSLALASALAIPAGILGGGWSVGVLTSLQYVLPDHERATGTALVLLITGLLGAVIGPTVAGQLSDFVAGHGATGIRTGLSVALPTGFIGVWAALAAARTLDADRATLAQGTTI